MSVFFFSTSANIVEESKSTQKIRYKDSLQNVQNRFGLETTKDVLIRMSNRPFREDI